MQKAPVLEEVVTLIVLRKMVAMTDIKYYIIIITNALMYKQYFTAVVGWGGAHF